MTEMSLSARDAVRHAASAVALIPPNASAAVLMRHAERGEFAKGDHGNEVLLTKQGEKDAVVMGGVFQNRRISLVHSPVKRCLQTALGIGCENALAEEPKEWLPLRCDAYIEDIEGAEPTLMRLVAGDGFYDEFVRTLSDTTYEPPYPYFFPPLPAAAGLMAGMMPAQGENKITIGISHDWLVNVTASHAAGCAIQRKDFADYLDALFVWRDADGLHYYHKGKSGLCAEGFAREFNNARDKG